MMDWTMVIHENKDVGQIVSHLLDPAAHGKVHHARNLGEASDLLMLHGLPSCHQIISSASAPADADQAQALECHSPHAVATFLKNAQRLNPAVQCCVLVAVEGDNSLGTFDELSFVKLLTITELLTPRPAPQGPIRRRHDVDVDIILSGDVGEWVIRGTQDPRVKPRGQILVGWRNMQRLMTDSERANTASDKAMHQLGRDMYEYLLMARAGSSKLELELAKCTQPPGSLESVRFRFQVDKRSNSLLFETIAKPHSEHDNSELDLWMLHTPIFRNYEGTGTRHPLFKDKRSRQEALRCLIIEGETGDFSAGGRVGKHFNPLKYAKDEMTWLTEHFQSKYSFPVATPTIVRFQEGEQRATALRKVLRTAPQHWHLIHYLGHTTIGDDDKGYLVLGQGPDDLMPIDEFGELAADTQFVFLNSCQSGDSSFIMNLVKHNIPAIAGYAWRIDDKAAYAFARKFYECLFAGEVSQRFLEYAFMNARAHLHQRAKGGSVWAAPLLFMHGKEAEPD